MSTAHVTEQQYVKNQLNRYQTWIERWQANPSDPGIVAEACEFWRRHPTVDAFHRKHWKIDEDGDFKKKVDELERVAAIDAERRASDSTTSEKQQLVKLSRSVIESNLRLLACVNLLQAHDECYKSAVAILSLFAAENKISNIGFEDRKRGDASIKMIKTVLAQSATAGSETDVRTDTRENPGVINRTS